MFTAMVVEKDEEGKTSAALQQMSEDQLPEGRFWLPLNIPQ
jgi:acrylyl-CoA reductase (NADPH)